MMRILFVALLAVGLAAQESRGHWSFVAPVRSAVPAVAGEPELQAIDAFVRARLVGTGLRAAPEADRRGLIRRLSLDLIGLPPTPAEVAAFVDDARSDA